MHHNTYCSLVIRSMPLALFSFRAWKHSHSNSLFIRWNKLLNWAFGSLRAFSAMRCSFVSTGSSFLCMICMSLQCCYCCNGLSSSGITRPQRYYATVRLPASHQLVLTLLSLVPILHSSLSDAAGSPELPNYSQYPTCHRLRPRGSNTAPVKYALYYVDFQIFNSVVLPIFRLRGSIRSTSAYGLLS